MTRALAAMFLVGSLSVVTGCSPTPVATDLYGQWVLVAGTDSTGQLDSTVTEVTLDIGNKTVGGRVCNSYGGEFTGPANDLTIGPLAATEMYCTEPDGIMDLETRFLTDLDAVRSGEVVDGRLILTGPDITLEFAPVG